MKGSYTIRPAKWLVGGCMVFAAFNGDTLYAILLAVLMVLVELGEIRDILAAKGASDAQS